VLVGAAGFFIVLIMGRDIVADTQQMIQAMNEIKNKLGSISVLH